MTGGDGGGQPGVPSPGRVEKGGLGLHNTWKANQPPLAQLAKTAAAWAEAPGAARWSPGSRSPRAGRKPRVRRAGAISGSKHEAPERS